MDTKDFQIDLGGVALEEPGAPEEVAAIAFSWFADHMRKPGITATALAG